MINAACLLTFAYQSEKLHIITLTSPVQPVQSIYAGENLRKYCKKFYFSHKENHLNYRHRYHSSSDIDVHHICPWSTIPQWQIRFSSLHGKCVRYCLAKNELSKSLILKTWHRQLIVGRRPVIESIFRSRMSQWRTGPVHFEASCRWLMRLHR